MSGHSFVQKFMRMSMSTHCGVPCDLLQSWLLTIIHFHNDHSFLFVFDKTQMYWCVCGYAGALPGWSFKPSCTCGCKQDGSYGITTRLGYASPSDIFARHSYICHGAGGSCRSYARSAWICQRVVIIKSRMFHLLIRLCCIHMHWSSRQNTSHCMRILGGVIELCHVR